jgi:cell division protein FtsN
MSSQVSSHHAQRGNTVTGLLIGLLIGVLIAAGVALYINFGPKPFVTKVEQAPRPSQSAPVGQSAPIALPGKPGDTPVEKPKFDFYKILPGGESASAPVSNKPAEAAPERTYLQAGAFQNPSDADNLKARLALMGIEANVQRVDLAEKGVFYRVRLGGFATPDAADSMRAKLLTEGIEASVVRSKP